MRTRLLLLILAPLFAPALLPADEPAPTELRCLGYNVQFLPGPGKLFNKRGNDDYRPHALAKALASYDIICLSEVFELGPRQIILADLKEAWKDRFHVYETPEPAPSVGRYNAGLTIVSRYPLVATNHIAYSAWSTKKEFGVFADEFAQKGALHARIKIDRVQTPFEIDVFDTHLDSKLRSARQVQVNELAQLAEAQTSPTRSALFFGDFNIRGDKKNQPNNNAEYQGLLERFRKARPDLIDGWLAVGTGDGGTGDQIEGGGGSRIDYAFFSPGNTTRLELKSVASLPFLDPKVEALSDHNAVEAIFTIKEN